MKASTIRNKIKVLGIFIIFLFKTTIIPAQVEYSNEVDKNDLIFRVQYFTGSVYQYYSDNVVDKSKYLEFGLLWQTKGTKSWHNKYRNPEVGFGVLLADFGNDSIYGQSFAFYPQWNVHVINKKHFNLDIRLACGLAYFNNPYDRNSNPSNILIGSHVNNYTSMGILLRYKTSNHLDFYGSANLFHYSNAHSGIPNLGANDFPFSLGVSYKIGETKVVNKPVIDSTQKKWHINIRPSFAQHKFAESVNPVYGPSYPIYSLSLFMSHQYGKFSDLHLGVIGTYYSSYYDIIKLEEWFKDQEFINSCVFSALIGQEFLISHVALMIEADINVFNPFFEKRYENTLEPFNSQWLKSYIGGKLGFTYYPFKKSENPHNLLGIGVFLKTHLLQADFFEVNITYSL